jgi:hypothetical protein
LEISCGTSPCHLHFRQDKNLHDLVSVKLWRLPENWQPTLAAFFITQYPNDYWDHEYWIVWRLMRFYFDLFFSFRYFVSRLPGACCLFSAALLL